MTNDPRRITPILLGLLTIFAGAIRFFHLSHPPLWFDESMVFRRTCGTYAQLLDCLRTDGFVPLHYSLVWVISRFLKPTPIVLRFFPALCGTLMVPAVYFLSRQLLDRTTSLVAAAFTACSAFMLFYSRDAKMYMDAWLFVTLNAASLLWWFRSQKGTAWLCWIASGCAACGLHFSSVIPLAISSLLLFSQRRLRWQGTVVWIVGAVVILSGPIGYYEKFNRWEDRVDEEGWRDSGLQWINAYNFGRTGPELFRYLGTSMMMGWEWPKPLDLPTIPPTRVRWPARAAEFILLLFVAACLPWRTIWKTQTPVLRYPEEPDLLVTPLKNPALRGTSEPASVESQWRVALWLSLWIALPLYGFYCRSMPDFFTPLGWWYWLTDRYPILLLPTHHHWFGIVIAMGVIGAMLSPIWIPRLRLPVFHACKLLIVFIVLLGLFEAMAVVMAALSRAALAADKPWQSLWVPRYIGFIWPMLAVAAAALLMRLPTRWVRGGAVLFLLILNLGVASYRIFGQTEPPVDLMASDAFLAEHSNHQTLCWMHLRPSMSSPGGANLYGEPGQYYLQLLENGPTDPVLFRTQMHERKLQNLAMRFNPWNSDAAASATRIIVWNEFDREGNAIFPERVLPPAMWKIENEQSFAARDCWIWQDLDRYRRTVYVRQSSK